MPRRPSLSTDRQLGKTTHPLRLVARAVRNCHPSQSVLEHRPLRGQDSPYPHVGEPGMLGTAVRRRPSSSTDRQLGSTPRPLRLVSPGRWELLCPAVPP